MSNIRGSKCKYLESAIEATLEMFILALGHQFTEVSRCICYFLLKTRKIAKNNALMKLRSLSSFRALYRHHRKNSNKTALYFLRIKRPYYYP